MTNIRAAYPYYVVFCLMVASAFSFLDRLALSMMIEPIKAELSLSDTQVSILAGAAFAVFYVGFALVFGRWVDTHGRRNAIVFGISVWSLATAACGLASSFLHLFVARSLIGVGEASLNPSAYSMIADYFKTTRRSVATAIFACGATVGGGLAIMMGGQLISWANTADPSLPFLPDLSAWQFVFIIIGLPGLLVALLIALTVREPARQLVVGETTDIPGLRDARIYLAKNARSLGPLFAAFSCNAIIGYSFMVWGPVHFMRMHQLDAGDVGLLLGIGFGVGGTIGLLAGGAIADALVRRGRIEAPVLVSLAAVIVDTPLFIGAYLSTNLTVASVLFCLGMAVASMTGGLQISMVQSLAPNRLRGIMAAVFGACVNLAGFGIAPTITAMLAENLYGGEMGIGKALATMTVVAGLGAVILFLIGLAPGRRLALSLEGNTAPSPQA
ncbi:MFS transporter [Hyphomonas johnsonii]|uniref:Major facilitator superfamily permease n=1 Tax=Hyphomonas johnsonii MHS-2 TaxID=1280950 RepID=A0A059FN67_9PROT|nr:MFS transporter [Hyphomonas johnsonii]KCZ92120.1 major facilitator superfamily permease [Hyphomonas johnsonii MHS-2]